MKFILTGLTFFYLACSPNKISPLWIKKPVPLANKTDRTWQQGWLVVPENRKNPQSRNIEIPFILSMPDDSLRSSASTILIMSGGPGNSSLHMANGVVNTIWGKNNNVLILEQRGTKYAKPALVCPEIDSFRIMGLKAGLSGKALDSLKLVGVKLSHDRFIAQHVELDGYNTLESVEDIECLRKALDIKKIILYGMSYSCNLMMTYAQSYPEHVEAVILDSPLPHHVNYDEDAYQNIDSTLVRIVEHYTGTRTIYNDWKNYLDSIASLEFTISVDSVKYKYTKNELIDVVLFKMSSHDNLSEVANTMQRLVKNEHKEVEDIIRYYLEPSGQALGMRFSVWIGEELPEEKLPRIIQKQKQYNWLAGYAVNDVSHQTARFWPVHSIYEAYTWPVSTYNGPVLVLSGEFDPWTPEWYGDEMRKYAPNTRRIIYKNKTHLPGFTDEGFGDINGFIIGLKK